MVRVLTYGAAGGKLWFVQPEFRLPAPRGDRQTCTDPKCACWLLLFISLSVNTDKNSAKWQVFQRPLPEAMAPRLDHKGRLWPVSVREINSALLCTCSGGWR